MLAKARSSSPVDKERLAVALILLLFVFLATAYSLVTPLFEGFDEHWHFAYVQYIASERSLPRQPAEQYPHLARQEASQPPLYYWLASLVVRSIPSSDLESLLRKNPQFAPVPWGYRDNQNLIVHTDAERFPYRGTVLAVHLSRILSVLLGAGTVYCSYALARLLFPSQRALAIGAMLVTALTPSFIFASALVNNDILVALLSSVTLVLLVRIWQNHASLAAGVWLGLALGCAALSKLSGLLLWPVAALVLLALAWHRRDWRILVRVGLPAFALAGMVGGWWYARNWALYHDFSGLNGMLDIVGRRDPGFGLRDALAELEGVRRSYWALFGWFNVPVATWLYRVYDLISLVGLLGLVLFAIQAIRHHKRRNVAAIVFLCTWLAICIISLVRWTLLTSGSQGRLLYPAISAISILLVLGWLQLVSRREAIRRSAVILIGLVFLAVAVYVPIFVIEPAYARPTSLQAEQVAREVSLKLNVRFEDMVTLLGYRVDRQEVKPGDVLWLTLCWTGSRNIETDLSVFVQLLAENDLIAAQRDSYHGLGSYPTSLWPTNTTFCDRYPLRVTDTVPAPSQGTLSIGLYDSTGTRLQASTDDGQPLGDNVRLAGPAIKLPEDGRALEYEFGHRVALIDYQLEKTAIAPGDCLDISLVWRAIKQTRSDYVATIQILDERGTKIGQSDIPLPTSTWLPGSTTTDDRIIAISSDASAGVYAIKVAVYDPITVQNLVLYRRREALSDGGLLSLWTVRVLPLPAQAQR